VVHHHEAVGLGGFTAESELALLGVLWDSFGTRGASKTELRDASGQAKSTYYRSINALVSKGLVLERKEGRSTYYTPAAENRQQHPGPARESVPIYIEMSRMAAVRAEFERVPPPFISRAFDTHMVWNEVDDQTHTGMPQGVAEFKETRLSAQFRTDRRMVDDVIAVSAAGPCPENGRSIDM
jgi:predicted transcriptional regulator